MLLVDYALYMKQRERYLAGNKSDKSLQFFSFQDPGKDATRRLDVADSARYMIISISRS